MSWEKVRLGDVTDSCLGKMLDQEKNKGDYHPYLANVNIFLIFPDMSAKWWVWDVLTNKRSSVQLSPSQIIRKKAPFIIEQHIFDELISRFGDNESNEVSL